MENKKKSAVVRFPVILLAFFAILLFALPCAALEVPLSDGQTTLNIDYPINESVSVNDGGTLNLLDGGVINGGVGVGEGGTLNILGGYIRDDLFIAFGSEVNIKGGGIGGFVGAWDISVAAEAQVTVFGTDFSITSGTMDPSGAYFTLGEWSPCLLTGTYGGDAGFIELIFCAFISDVRIFLTSPVSVQEVIIDIKPCSDKNNINLKSKGVVPVAVMTTDSFVADTIDPSTVKFAGAAPVRWKLEDVDDDGDYDMMFHFRTQELELGEDSTEATLEARLAGLVAIQSTEQLSEGTVISGTDKVRIVSSKKSKK